MPDEPGKKTKHTPEIALELMQKSDQIYASLGSVRTISEGKKRVDIAKGYLEAMTNAYADAIGGVENREEFLAALDGTQEFQEVRRVIGLLAKDLGLRQLDKLILEIDQAIYGRTAGGYASRTPVEDEDKRGDEKLSTYRLQTLERLLREIPETKKGP